ncbi:MAG: hypothetical protein LBU65_02635 [Planctomycetaceae bacterium]|jgi:flagellin-like hook-associated protein FlgL|nr:hypothetical protein [Planctomycetaceae bacterium]
MSSISPLSYSRVSMPLQYTNSLTSLNYQQTMMAMYERQLETQVRYQYGSEAPFDSSVTLTTQADMQRREQNSTNVKSSQSYLTATDNALSQIGSLVNDIRSMGLDAINTTTSQTQRTSLAETVNQTLQSLFDFGNKQYQGRFLFAGSATTTMPFSWSNGTYSVTYNGNEQAIPTWADAALLSLSNMNGADVFGAISEPVRGITDLNPAITSNTLLSKLNGGNGVDKGAIRLSYTSSQGTKSVDIDLSKCVTMNDVRRAISEQAPADVQVSLSENGLCITLSEESPGTLRIEEVGKGMVANQLGILTKQPIRSGTTLRGNDLNPIVDATTNIEDLFGSKSRASLRFQGANNDIIIEAKQNGESVIDPVTGEKLWTLNGTKIVFVSDSAIVPGSEYADYDAAKTQITVHIHPDNTSANNIVDAINKASAAGTIPPVTASLDTLDKSSGTAAAGTGLVPLLPGVTYDYGTMQYGSGEPFDTTSGLEIVNGGKTTVINFDNCKTVSELLAVFNEPSLGLVAEINAAGNGIDVRSRVSGTDFAIGENGGRTASQLGIRSLTTSTVLNSLDYGRGVMDYDGPGTNAAAVYESKSANSALRLVARNEGESWNDYAINFVPTEDPNGAVTIAWDEDAKSITIGIVAGTTKACDVIDAFEKQPGPKQFFDLQLDTTNGMNDGSGVVYDGFTKTSGGTDGGIDFTITRNDGKVMKIDIGSAVTIGDVINLINENSANEDGLLTARLNQYGNGIELVDNSFGTGTTRVDRELLSTAAIDLGLVPRGEEYRTVTYSGNNASATLQGANENSSLMFLAKQNGVYGNGVKVEFVDMNAAGGSGQPGFTWDAINQTLRFEIDPSSTTANDVVSLFQSQASETVRQMFDVQNALNADGSTSNGKGIVTLTSEAASTKLTGGEAARLSGSDPNPQEVESLYTAVIRLQTAMMNNDTREMERAISMLDGAMATLNTSRAEIGVRQISLDSVTEQLANEEVQNKQLLLDFHEINIATVSMGYLMQQLAYQATLSVSANFAQMSMLNYI